MKQDFELEMIAVADQLYATVKHHEAKSNDGKPCSDARFAAIALLCARLGMNPRKKTLGLLGCFVETIYEEGTKGIGGHERQHDDSDELPF